MRRRGDELIALAQQLDLDAVIARVEDLRVGRARAQRRPRDARDLRLLIFEVGVDVVAGDDLVAAGAEFHLGRRARCRGTPPRRRAAPAVVDVAERAPQGAFSSSVIALTSWTRMRKW